jgi:hypothetical protein
MFFHKFKRTNCQCWTIFNEISFKLLKLYLTFSRLCYEKEEVVIDQLHHLNLGKNEEQTF